MFTRPVWVEISRRKLTANYRELRRLADRHDGPHCRIELLCVVKANAYGHGVSECAPLLTAAGAKWLGVTSLDEGVEVRALCPGARILVMSGIYQGEAEAVIEHDLTPVVWESSHLDLLERAMLRHAPKSLPVHVEIDTGMSRQGIRQMEIGGVDGNEIPDLLQKLQNSPLRIEALMTHFSAPEVLDAPDTVEQIARLEAVRASIAMQGLHPEFLSAGNSATLLLEREVDTLQRMAANIGAGVMLRPGLALCGYLPRFVEGGRAAVFAGGNPFPELQPVLAWKTRIASLRNIRAGETAGYNGTFRATRNTRLALLPLGYADGVNRLLSNRGSVLVRGRRAPIVGRVSMDQTIVDVTDIPGVEIGDEVVLIGSQGSISIDAYELADLIGTIPYEVLCGISSRVPRVYVD